MSAARMEKYKAWFERIFPADLREGPYHPLFYLYAGIGLFALHLMHKPAVSAFDDIVYNSPLPEYHEGWPYVAAHIALLAFCWGTFAHMYIKYSLWPLVSYTMMSFSWLTLRVTLGFVGRVFGVKSATLAATLISFPTLAGASVTVGVWWLGIAPIVWFALRNKPSERKWFKDFNLLPFTVAIHGVNIFVAAADFLFTGPRRYDLGVWDMYLALLFVLFYQTFYQAVLDPRGMHFYIILSPRKFWCIFVYFAFCGLYYAIFLAWNSAAVSVHGGIYDHAQLVTDATKNAAPASPEPPVAPAGEL